MGLRRFAMSDELRVMSYKQWAMGNAMGDKMIRRYAEQENATRNGKSDGKMTCTFSFS